MNEAPLNEAPLMVKYYYAQGQRIPIELDREQIAIHADKASHAGLASLASSAQTRLPGGLLLVLRSAVKSSDIKALESVGATQNVYTHGTTTLVPLPEVRVEFDTKSQKRDLLEALPKTKIRSDIVEESDHRVVLRPTSGSGDDAVSLANELVERAHPAMSSARMIQIAKRPDVYRRAGAAKPS